MSKKKRILNKIAVLENDIAKSVAILKRYNDGDEMTRAIMGDKVDKLAEEVIFNRGAVHAFRECLREYN